MERKNEFSKKEKNNIKMTTRFWHYLLFYPSRFLLLLFFVRFCFLFHLFNLPLLNIDIILVFNMHFSCYYSICYATYWTFIHFSFSFYGWFCFFFFSFCFFFSSFFFVFVASNCMQDPTYFVHINFFLQLFD